MAHQTEIDARMLHIKELYCEAEQHRAMKLAVSRQPKKPPTIFIPVSPRTLYQRIRKVIPLLAGRIVSRPGLPVRLGSLYQLILTPVRSKHTC